MKNTKGQEHHSERDKKIATTEQDKSECPLQASIFFFHHQKATKSAMLPTLRKKTILKTLHRKVIVSLFIYKYCNL